MKHYWITGADGFIGRHLSQHLLAQGHHVCALGFRDSPAVATNPRWADWAEGEVDAGLLDALATRQTVPDAIFHLAGGGSVGASFADPWGDFRRTVLSSGAVLDWVRRNAPRTRVLQISSAAVYGGGHEGHISESAVLDPYSPYGAHKLAAEALCQSAVKNFGVDAIIIRPFSIFGVGLRKQLLWDVARKLSDKPSVLELGGSGNEMRDWLPVEGLTGILAALAERDIPSGSVYNAGTGSATSVRQIVTWLASAIGAENVELNFSGVARAGDPEHLIADTGRLSALGILPQPDVRAAVTEYAEWFRMQSE